MDRFIRQCILYDFYGPLLTEHQQEVYEMAVYDDMSLQEIADELHISRQAIHDLIKRCDVILESYDNKLKLIERFDSCKKKLELLEAGIKNLRDKQGDISIDSLIDNIHSVIDNL